MIRKVREPFALVDLFFDRDSALARLPGVLASEGFGSSRVIRLPLTEADRALGFTGGIVSEIDGRGVNPGRSVVKVLDLNVEWRLTLGSGSLLLHGRGTWLPSLRRRGSDRDPWFQSAGFADGPLEWRANGGIAWSGRGSTVALTAQYFGSYSPAYSAPQMQAFNPTILRFHAGARIPDRLYFDLAVRHRLARRAPGLELGLGIINLFDKSPPLTADPQTPGYSFYGDPRRRRFHLALSSSF
jgi:outer membrane receptor protein involved in Fe transport